MFTKGTSIICSVRVVSILEGGDETGLTTADTVGVGRLGGRLVPGLGVGVRVGGLLVVGLRVVVDGRLVGVGRLLGGGFLVVVGLGGRLVGVGLLVGLGVAGRGGSCVVTFLGFDVALLDLSSKSELN